MNTNISVIWCFVVIKYGGGIALIRHNSWWHVTHSGVFPWWGFMHFQHFAVFSIMVHHSERMFMFDRVISIAFICERSIRWSSVREHNWSWHHMTFDERFNRDKHNNVCILIPIEAKTRTYDHVKYVNIGLNNGLPPDPREAVMWSNDHRLSIVP